MLQTALLAKDEEVTESKYYEMLGVLPPASMESNAFLVGEPDNHVNGVPVYGFYFQEGEKYFYGGSVSRRMFASFRLPQ